MQFRLIILPFLLWFGYQVCLAAEFEEQPSDNELSVNALRRIGIKESRKGNYHLALRHFYQALNLCEKNNDSVRYALTLINIGNLNSRLEDYDRAIELYFEAYSYYDHFKANPKSLGIRKAQIIMNIGRQYYAKKDYDNALKHFHKALKSNLQLDITEMELGYSNFGQVFVALEQYDSANYYLQKALNALQEKSGTDADFDYMVTHYLLGQIASNNENSLEAIDQFEQSYQIALSFGSKDYLAKNAKFLAKEYGKLQDFENGLFFSQIHNVYMDSLFKERNGKTAAKIESKYELERLTARNDLELQRRNLIIYFVLFALLVITVVLVMIYYNYKRSKKADKALFVKSEQLNIQKINELLKEQEIKSIRANIMGQEDERKRIAEELHDGIGGSLSSIKLSLGNNRNVSDAGGLQKVLDNIDQLCDEIRTISHNLTPPDFQHSAFVNLLNNYFSEFQNQLSIQLNCELYPDHELNKLPQYVQIELYRIIQEALSNIAKHANAKKVEIQLVKHEDYVNLIVEDNGIGFDGKLVLNGIGLKNISSRVRVLKGNFEIDSQLGRGTILNVDLKLINPVSSKQHTNHV